MFIVTSSPNALVTNDADLVRLAKNNDREAFGELVRRHHSRCLRFALSVVRDRGEAEDQVQNAFLKAFEHLSEFRGTADFSSWLLRIVANHCLMRLRSRVRTVYLDGDDSREGSAEVPATASDPEYGLIQSEMVGVLQREIRRIPMLLRKVVVLHDIQQLSMTDVARQLGITLPAAKSRLFRARHAVRQRVLECCGPKGYYMPRSSVQRLPARAVRCPVKRA